MVARINTVAFHGVEVQAVDVQVQISNGLPAFTVVGSNYPYTESKRSKIATCLKFCIFIISAFFLLGNPAHADDQWKKGALTCDEEKNRALIRLSAGYNNDPMPAIQLPEMYSQYSDLNSLPIKDTCTFKDGRKLFLSYATGQAFAYGAGRGDAPEHFTLRIDDKNIFYKKVFYGGYGSRSIDPVVIILDGEKLISCRGPEDSLKVSSADYTFNQTDCQDVSARLTKNLEGNELGIFEKDHTIKNYVPISIEHDTCSYFSNDDILFDLEKEKYERFSPHVDQGTRELVNKAPYSIGYASKESVDINNDGSKESIYQIGATNNYFDGSFLVFFTTEKAKMNFENCVFNKKCSESIPADKSDDVDFITTKAELLWPGTHIISANSLEAEISKEYRIRYTWLYPVNHKGQTYIYFDPLNDNIFPSGIVAKLRPDGKFETICTYKHGN